MIIKVHEHKVKEAVALKANGFKGKVQVNLNVRGEDDIETFFIDMGKNEAFNADREDWMNTRAYNTFAKSASDKYTVLAFDKRLYKVLADFDDAVKYFQYGDNGAIIPFLSKQGVEDLSEELASKGIEHCVFKQTLEIA